MMWCVVGPTSTPRLLGAGTAAYTLDPSSGAATLLGGSFGRVRALGMPEPAVGPDWDNDGLPDALDNCTLASNPAQIDVDADGYGNSCDADVNNDGIVSLRDINIIAGSFGCSVGAPGCEMALDTNENGVIDLQDINQLVQFFGRVPGPSGLPCAGAIPCP